MLKIKKLELSDGIDFFKMLKKIKDNENEFTNPVYDMNYEQYREWLKLMDDWSNGKSLKDGYVPQTIFWLLNDGIPVGVGKIRHYLTDSSKEFGGNIGYAISKEYRGKGYGSIFLKLLVKLLVIFLCKLLIIKSRNILR